MTRRARKAVALGLVLQGLDGAEAAPARVGFTASRKVGNAVARNRARRRLQAAACDVLSARAKAGWDYVLIARQATLERPYDALLSDLDKALSRLEANTRPSPADVADAKS
jgi:ribonuclease P protein component